MKDPNNSSAFLEYFRERVRHNQNSITCIVGGTGSGKSYAALKLAEKLDPDFDMDHVAFDAEKFLELIKREEKSGTAIVFDEAGVAWQSRSFMSKLNKILSYALQTVRFKNHYIFFTVPDLSFIDAQGRKLLHMIIKMNGFKRSDNLSRLRCYRIETDPLSGNDKTIFIRKLEKDGRVSAIEDVYCKMPSVKLRNRYEKAKLDYANELYRKSLADLGPSEKEKKDKLNILRETERTVFELDKAGVDTKRICQTVGINRQSVYNIRNKYRKLGLDIKTFN